MPRILSEQEYNGVKSRVISSAPDNLSESDFHRWLGPAMESALGEAENTAPQQPGINSPFGAGFVKDLVTNVAPRVIKGVAQNINPVTGAIGLYNAVSDLPGTYNGLVNNAAEQFTKAGDAYNQGHYSEMLGHGVAGALPLIGPAAAGAGEKIAGGDVAGGLGDAAGQLLLTGAARRLPGTAGRVARGVQDVLPAAAERIVASSLKIPATLTRQNRNVNIPRVILDEGLTRGGGFRPLTNAAARANELVESLSNDLSALPGMQNVRGLSLQQVVDQLDRLEAEYLHQPNPNIDIAAVRRAREQLMNHPLYSQQATMTVPTGVPGGHVVGQHNVSGGGMPTGSTTQVPIPGQRDLIPQAAAEIDRMKKNVYTGLKGKYGKEGAAVIESDKAMGRGLKQILDDNVPGAREINERQGGVIAARNALEGARLREANKYPFGLMDLAAIPGIVAGSHYGIPVVGQLGALLEAYALAMKHPTTALPLARGLDNLSRSTKLPLAAQIGAGALVGGKLIDNGQRSVTKDEIERVKALLAQD